MVLQRSAKPHLWYKTFLLQLSLAAHNLLSVQGNILREVNYYFTSVAVIFVASDLLILNIVSFIQLPTAVLHVHINKNVLIHLSKVFLARSPLKLMTRTTQDMTLPCFTPFDRLQ